ncbi:MAG: HAD-IB family hydrolase [Agriterribacter sp.]
MSKSIAFFDFDGTITFKDTLLEIIKYQRGSAGLYAGMLQLSPWMVAMKLKLISNQTAKEKLLAHFFKNTPVDVFQKNCDDFAQAMFPSLIRPKALEQIQAFKAAGTRVVIVSASPQNWLSFWCNINGLDCIGTILQKKNNLITGNIEGLNCYGEEKVRRIKAQYNLADYTQISCYGDTNGDKPMLALGTEAYYKPFRD